MRNMQDKFTALKRDVQMSKDARAAAAALDITEGASAASAAPSLSALESTQELQRELGMGGGAPAKPPRGLAAAAVDQPWEALLRFEPRALVWNERRTGLAAQHQAHKDASQLAEALHKEVAAALAVAEAEQRKETEAARRVRAQRHLLVVL